MSKQRKRKRYIRNAPEAHHDNYDPNVVAEVESLFQKRFTFDKPNGGQWQLPKLDVWFTQHWRHEALDDLENELNEVKSSLSHHDISLWHEHTQLTNRAGAVIFHLRRHRKPELCTQAWCKFYEIAASYQLLPLEEPMFGSVHLCEAPGAFIASLNHFLKGSGYRGVWNWKANTLNPHYEGNGTDAMIVEDRFICETLDHWYFGVDNTGDIMSQTNLNQLRKEVQEVAPVQLVTADGSMDFQNNPEDQERGTSQLHYCEVVTALHILSPGGALVAKMFTLFEATSVCLLYLLNCLFTEVHVFKPATSKSGNSEVYVIALGYQGASQEVLNRLRSHIGSEKPEFQLFPREGIPDDFLSQHQECCSNFTHWQMQTIRENKQLFGEMSPEMKERLEAVRRCCAAAYIRRYGVRHIGGQARVVPLFHTAGDPRCKKQKHFPPQRRHVGSFLDRQHQIALPWQQRLQEMQYYPLGDVSLHWLQGQWSLSEADVSEWSMVEGTRLCHIKSSPFCSLGLLKLWNELISHSQGSSNSELPIPSVDHMKEVLMLLRGSVPPEEEDTLVVNLRTKEGPVVACLKDAAGEKLRVSQDHDPEEDGVAIFVMEDSMSSTVEGPQEVQTKQQLIDNLLQALRKLAKGDHLIITFPGLTTRFTAGLLYILYMSFSKLCVLPPCRASSLQTVVGCHCHGVLPELVVYVESLQRSLADANDSLEDVLQIMPIHCLYDYSFHEYLSETNDLHLQNWINLMIRQQRSSTPPDPP